MKNLCMIFAFLFAPIYTFSQGYCYPNSNSPLINYFVQAMDNGDTTKMELYLNSGITINGTYCGNTAAFHGYFNLQTGLYHQFGDGFQKPFFMRAVENKNQLVLKFMIHKGADVNKYCLIPVTQYDPNAGYPGSPNQWVESPPAVVYPLNIALNKDFCLNRSKEIIKLLLDNGANPNVAVWDAKTTNDVNIMNLFVEKGVNFIFTAKDLLSAIQTNNEGAFNFYIKSGVKANCACFIEATKKADIKKLQLFLDQGCSVNCVNEYRWNPHTSNPEGVDPYVQLSSLGWAVSMGNLDLVKFLVENGANLNDRCITHDGMLDPAGKNQSLTEFSRNSVVTEYLLLAPVLQKKAQEEKQNNIQKYRAEAEAFIHQGKYSEASASYKKAFELSREKTDQDGIVMYFRKKGSNSVNKIHNYDSAAYYYNEAFKLSRSDVDKFFYTNSLLKLGQYDDAIKNLNELLSSTTIDKTYIYRLMGLSCQKKGNNEEAKNNFSKALEFIQINNYNGYYQRACIYSLLNDKDNSITNLKLAFEKGFKDLDALTNDHDFDNVSSTEEFIKVVHKFKKKLLK